MTNNFVKLTSKSGAGYQIVNIDHVVRVEIDDTGNAGVCFVNSPELVGLDATDAEELLGAMAALRMR